MCLIYDTVLNTEHSISGRIMAMGLTQPLNRNEYQEYFLGGKCGRCVGLATLPPSRTDCL